MIQQGDNVSITCLAGASGRVHGALGFSWAREKSLLPLVPGREVWEDLYPAGSVLKLYNVQRMGVGERRRVVRRGGAALGLRWPKTAPGALAAAVCPPGYSGETTRFCEPKTGQHGVKWRSPDFSNCVSDSLNDIYDQFERISNGYSWRRVSEIVREYGAVLRSLPALPGSGSAPLRHSREVLHYLLSPAGVGERTDSVEPLLAIYDNLLKHPDSFLDEEKIYELQNVLVETAAMSDSLDLQMQEFVVKAKPTGHDNAVQFRFHPRGSEEWLLASTGVELIGKTGNATVVAVYYHNLLARLPSLRRSIEFRSGREVEYVLGSQHVQLAAGGAPGAGPPPSVSLLFTHLNNYTAIASRLACGARTAGEPGAWSMRACEVRVPEPAHVACRCRGLGTYALFTVARSTLTDSEKDLRGVVKITVGVGGAMCLAAAALQLLGLAPGGRARLPALLRAATAGTHGAAVLALLECDTRQEEACPGALGWVCAACWCAGSAALCAQPLLLQAELAGRGQHLSSVALLAGVCTLAWLTARLWGGAPLQVGAAAQAVCAGGCALLAALCTALALCAALRLRTITHKVPAERRNYLRDRRRTVRHTLALVVSTAAAQAAGVAYAQPGERRRAHIVALSTAALVNGITMVVCYVLRDEECLRAARRVLALGPAHGAPWADSPAGDTSLSCTNRY
ncbi:hypothetical protein EVAR_58036_1 [Eumeta japonica]|uniref:G-protein coupled receptors family 2 profile 1 domain-containing protein n=1 Tax=Eumeta variegata TaxID=151549 RepID=A0A4C1ZFQ4_EUMVA|nr:hypothetical protein EVAR_58036_1 [Eumeta japonica]